MINTAPHKRIVAVLAVLAVLATGAAGCSTASKSGGYTVPVAADQVQRNRKSTQKYRTHSFYERKKGVFDSMAVRLYSVQCLNGKKSDSMIYPNGNNWCEYFVLRPPKCHDTLDGAMRDVCQDSEAESKAQKTRKEKSGWAALLPF